MIDRGEVTAGSTRYAGLSPQGAGVVLLCLAMAVGWCLWTVATRQTGQLTPPSDEKKRDVLLFRAVVERVQNGEGYYDAWGAEARARGYPTRSLFNWRLPLFAWVNGKLPSVFWGQLLLCGLALTSILLAYGIIRSENGIATAMTAVVIMGFAVAACVKPNVFLTTELWAGTLIAVSIGAYGHGWPWLGLGTGLLALYFRELALPYCLISLMLAWGRGGRGEVAGWCLGLVLFVLYLGLHSMEVARHQSVNDLAHTEGWIRFGGTAFVLSTVGIHLLLSDLPTWTWAFYLSLSILGLAGWRGPVGRRVSLTAGAYLAGFSVIGQPFNNYWGLIDAPLLALGFALSPRSIRELFACLRSPKDDPVTPPIDPQESPHGKRDP